MHRNFASSSVIVFSALFLLLVAACGSKVSRANFEKIQTDMAQEEVYKILGEPTESSGITIGAFSGTSATWTNEEGVISIQFLNGKVVAKQYVKGKNIPQAQKD